MADTALNVLAGVIAKLKATTSITDVVVDRIYTNLPQSTVFPFVLVSISSSPFSAKDFSGLMHRVRVQCFSQKSSLNEALTLRKNVFTALDRQESSITVTGATLVRCELASLSDVFREDDGVTWQAVNEFDLVVQ